MGLFRKKSTSSAPVHDPNAPVHDPNAPIQVLGGGCAKCNALEESTRQALSELGLDLAVGHITDFSEIAALGVMSTPALMVDGKVVSSGRVLTKDQAKELILQVREVEHE